MTISVGKRRVTITLIATTVYIDESCHNYHAHCSYLDESCHNYHAHCSYLDESCHNYHAHCSYIDESCHNYHAHCSYLDESCHNYHAHCSYIDENGHATNFVKQLCVWVKHVRFDETTTVLTVQSNLLRGGDRSHNIDCIIIHIMVDSQKHFRMCSKSGKSWSFLRLTDYF